MEIQAEFVAGTLAIIGFICLAIFRHNREIAIVKASVTETNGKLALQSQVLQDIKDDIELLSNRLDVFLKSEIDTLKDIAESVKKNK